MIACMMSEANFCLLAELHHASMLCVMCFFTIVRFPAKGFRLTSWDSRVGEALPCMQEPSPKEHPCL